MTRVVALAHVKESAPKASPPPVQRVRIPWHGGKISSNKEEAVRKFYERKLRRGEELTPEQLERVQKILTSSTKKSTTPTVHVNEPSDTQRHSSKKSQPTRPKNGKVVMRGRVLGPKVSSKSTPKKKTGRLSSNQIAKTSKMDIGDQLSLPLDALMGNNGSSRRKR